MLKMELGRSLQPMGRRRLADRVSRSEALLNALFWRRAIAAPFSDAELRFRLPQRFGKAAFANSQHNPVQHTLLATSRRHSILIFRLPQQFGKAALANNQRNLVQHAILATNHHRSILILTPPNAISGCLIITPIPPPCRHSSSPIPFTLPRCVWASWRVSGCLALGRGSFGRRRCWHYQHGRFAARNAVALPSFRLPLRLFARWRARRMAWCARKSRSIINGLLPIRRSPFCCGWRLRGCPSATSRAERALSAWGSLKMVGRIGCCLRITRRGIGAWARCGR